MLSISITGTIAIGLAILALVGMFLYWGKKGPDDENLTDDGNNDPFEDSELIYGSAVQVDKKFAKAHGLRTGEYYFITLPTIDTPINHVRVTTNNGDLDVPRHRIKSIVYDIETGGIDPYEKKYPNGNNVSQRNSDPFSQGIIAQLSTQGMISEMIANGDLDQIDGREEKSFGNGGEFAGGGASGRWTEEKQSESPFSDSHIFREARGLKTEYSDTNHQSNYSPSHDTSSYSSHDSSSHSSDSYSSHDSGSSYSDSGSSDTSSPSGGDSW